MTEWNYESALDLDVDWSKQPMSIHFYEGDPPADELLRFVENGPVYVRGVPTTDEKEIWAVLRAWLRANRYMMEVEDPSK